MINPQVGQRVTSHVVTRGREFRYIGYIAAVNRRGETRVVMQPTDESWQWVPGAWEFTELLGPSLLHWTGERWSY